MCGGRDGFNTRCEGRGWTWNGSRRVPCRSCNATGIHTPERLRYQGPLPPIADPIRGER